MLTETTVLHPSIRRLKSDRLLHLKLIHTLHPKKSLPAMRKIEQSTYIWLRRLNVTPKSMWIMPRITDIFILNELRKASLLLAIFQICEKTNTESAKH